MFISMRINRESPTSYWDFKDIFPTILIWIKARPFFIPAMDSREEMFTLGILEDMRDQQPELLQEEQQFPTSICQ